MRGTSLNLKNIRIRLLFVLVFSTHLLHPIVSHMRSGYFLKLSDSNPTTDTESSLRDDMACAHKCLEKNDCQFVANGIYPGSCTLLNSLPNLPHVEGLLRKTGYYEDCLDAKYQGVAQSSVQSIAISSLSKVINVYCDMDFDGGGWIVIQRRVNGQVSFERNWQQYQNGFGNLNGDFWIGLEYLHALTARKAVKLHIDLKNYHNGSGYADYSTFSVSGVQDLYRLTVSGFSGNVGDGLTDPTYPQRIANGQPFSTYDNDNDPSSTSNCAALKKGGWWFNKCYNSHVNGVFGESHGDDKHISWIPWKGTVGDIKYVEMKIKPVS